MTTDRHETPNSNSKPYSPYNTHESSFAGSTSSASARVCPMEDDALPNLAVTDCRPRKAWSNTKAFRQLQRELRGGDLRWDPRFHRPADAYCETLDRSERAFWGASCKRVLKTVRIDTLHGQHHLRDYVILGEKPTFPHHLIAVHRPIANRSLPEDRLKAGCISYWALNLTSNSIKEVGFTDYYANSPSCLSDYSLSAAFTAWDIDHDKVAQVLVWDFAIEGMSRLSDGDHIAWQKLEFRYGTQNVVVGNEDAGETNTPVVMEVCFAGLPGTQEGVCVRLLFSSKLVLYEPFGGSKQYYGNVFWTTAPETLLPTNENKKNDKTYFNTPLVTTVDLSRIASAHLIAVLKIYADTPPNFTYPYSTFISTQRPVRFNPGERQRFDRKCVLGFGAIESRSKMYHLFVIIIDAVTHTHRIMVAKAFSSAGVFDWKNMHDTGARHLFRKALARVATVGGRHDCRVDCEPSVDGLEGLERYEIWSEVVKVIEMEKEGIALVGWNAHGDDVRR